MEIIKTQFSTQLSDLYGRDGYAPHIEVGREYWWNWPTNSDVYKKTQKSWHKIQITYIRSGCMFYFLTDAPEVGEFFAPIKCFFTSTLILAEIDPIKDLNLLSSGENIELCKIKMRFNDEHTIVKNWPNEKRIEIDEEELFNKFGNTSDYLEFILWKKLNT